MSSSRKSNKIVEQEGKAVRKETNNISTDLDDFLGKCLPLNVSERWSARQLLGHPFLIIDVNYDIIVNFIRSESQYQENEAKVLKGATSTKDMWNNETKRCEMFMQYDNEEGTEVNREEMCYKKREKYELLMSEEKQKGTGRKEIYGKR